MKQTKFKGIYRRGRALLTENLVKGQSVYGERLFKEGKKEYRGWEPRRSKLAAAIMNGLRNVPIRSNSCVLYLGASTGTTVSHISDIARDGKVYAVDIAPRVVRELVFLSEKRKNVFPLLFSAALPEDYANIVEQVDFIYQDIAAPNQAEIFVKNADIFLKKGGYGMLALKARSINVAEKPKMVFDRIENMLRKHFKVIDRRRLEPFEKDHKLFLVVKE